MKILIHSPAFLPRVGGLEFQTAMLAAGLTQRGHEVIVWTTTPAELGKEEDATFRTVRRPTPFSALRMTRWCDVFLHQNLSLRGGWPLLVFHRPWAISHHSWYSRPDGRLSWRDRLKRWVTRRADASIAVSAAMARDLGANTEVIANSYRDSVFRRMPTIPRDLDLIFVGRLVSDKGADILLEALGSLGAAAPRLSIVGDGPERAALEEQAIDLGLGTAVAFHGTITGTPLAELLNRHRILVVPSRYNEPFGIVALEGVACGCAIIGTAGGGLPEAIGPCGLVVENGSPRALAQAILRVIENPTLEASFSARASAHLARHTIAATTGRYDELLQRIIATRTRNA